MTSSRKPAYHYVAYIDEAGEDGLRTVRPIDPSGSSEWLILGAMLVDAARETEVQAWHHQTLKLLRSRQMRDIHFRKLNDDRKAKVCGYMADFPMRAFVLASNKKNMRRYKNPLPEKIPSKNWFYCWLTRLLLERVTHYVTQRSLQKYGAIKRVKLVYSDRGGLSYAQMNAYYDWLRYKAESGRQFLALGDLHYETLHRDLLEVYPHNQKPGLQFADAVASAFYKACDVYHTGGCDPHFAKLLEPRMARVPDKPDGQIAGYGLKLMPSLQGARLRADQQEVFRFYGYPKQWWAPAPSDP